MPRKPKPKIGTDETWNLKETQTAKPTGDQKTAPLMVRIDRDLVADLRDRKDAANRNRTREGRKLVQLGAMVEEALRDFLKKKSPKSLQ